MTRQIIALVVGWSMCAFSARAHDLWLIPPDTASTGKPVTIQASVGMDFPISVFAPDTERYPGKFVIAPDGKKLALKSAGKQDLLALLQFETTQAGIHVVAVETTPKVLELSAEKFNDYLVTDGLPHIFRLRSKEGTLGQPARERYRKSPKALVPIGDAKAGAWSKSLGLPLEITPLRNPFTLKPGDTLGVRVDFQGKPLAQANLGWHRPGDGDTPGGTVRTSAKGEALIPIAEPGLLTIRLTHMTRPKTADYEWESFWTTLTLRLP